MNEKFYILIGFVTSLFLLLIVSYFIIKVRQVNVLIFVNVLIILELLLIYVFPKFSYIRVSCLITETSVMFTYGLIYLDKRRVLFSLIAILLGVIGVSINLLTRAVWFDIALINIVLSICLLVFLWKNNLFIIGFSILNVLSAVIFILDYNTDKLLLNDVLLAAKAMVCGLVPLYMITSYRNEKEASQLELLESQKMALAISQVNESLVREQNVLLEAKVQDRTEALQHSNRELSEQLTERIILERKLIASERNNVLGKLISEVIHDINNPLNYVAGGLRTLIKILNTNFRLREAYEKHISNTEITNQIKASCDTDGDDIHIADLTIQNVNIGLTNIEKITDSLYKFSKFGNEEPKFIDIAEILNNVLIILSTQLSSRGIEINKEIEVQYPFQLINGHLERILMNLLSNSIDAFKDSYANSPRNIDIRLATTENGELQVVVQDNGCGIAPTYIQEVTEPYFSTKENGFGLGLSIVNDIIISNNGSLSIASEQGKYTTVKIILNNLV